MRFSNRLVGLTQPNWKTISIVAVWLVFGWNFLGLPILRAWQDPKSDIHHEPLSYDKFQATVDSAFALRDRGLKLGDNYRAKDYARDMVWLRAREHEAIHWDPPTGRSAFDICVANLNDLASRSEYNAYVASSKAKSVPPVIIERMAKQAAWQEIQFAVNEYRGGTELRPMSAKDVLRFVRHFSLANLWAMLATMILLLLRLALSRKYSFWDEVLLEPQRLLVASFWWGYGIENYPGYDLAGEIRFVKLRRKFLKDKERYELTRHEEAALRLMARDRVIRFEEALNTVGNLGTSIAFQRRPLFTALLIWVTSGSFALRPSYATAADSVVIQKVVPATPADPLLITVIRVRAEQKQFTPMGGNDFSSVGSPAMPSLINSAEPDIVCLGGTVLMDKRRRFRTIRTTESRAPPIIIDGGTR